MKPDWLGPVYDTAKEPFEISQRWVNLASLAFSTYTILVIYPVYLLLRYLWGTSVFSLESLIIALASAVAFGLFARKTMANYARRKPKSD